MTAIPPLAHPPHRIDDARSVATEAGWPAGCPDPACRAGEAGAEGRCAGALRSVGGGPRSFPTCLALVARAALDFEALTVREASAFLHFLRPGEGWRLGTLAPAEDGGGEALLPDPEEENGEPDEPATPGQALMVVVSCLAQAQAEAARHAAARGRDARDGPLA